ncbi:MAG: PilZ domain-containing protein [Candidatus Thiodiazotropha endolucinida]|uniref:PilZ domain-containing protein n=1 Tax=Candidatus Thiodiazotropha taylori TaxID=2792791 RepID=A0A9E4NH47_9GAMM|nr:PilZ domain-containing protein [Candidatus Thiodiazotropha taylori]MCW4234967.1 PilZ domain-containing protein [Candidatus Thiodiazotropha endolucinida]
MQEQRHSPRKVANEVLIITDQITGSHIGRVVNISAEGLMLLSDEAMVTGSVYQLDLILPIPKNDQKKISFTAEAVWCTEASQPDSFWSGFHIIDINPDDVLIIDELILDWHSN